MGIILWPMEKTPHDPEGGGSEMVRGGAGL